MLHLAVTRGNEIVLAFIAILMVVRFVVVFLLVFYFLLAVSSDTLQVV